MTVDEIIKYVMETPHNTNKAVLKPMLESLAREGGEEPSQDITLTTLEVTENQTYTASENTAYNTVIVNVPDNFETATLTISNLAEELEPGDLEIEFPYITRTETDSTIKCYFNTAMSDSFEVPMKPVSTIVFPNSNWLEYNVTYGENIVPSTSNGIFILKGDETLTITNK